ncbi:MAG: alpha/beta hydrolase [Granulosicoccus sp.]
MFASPNESRICKFAAGIVLILVLMPLHASNAIFESRHIKATGADGELAGTLLLPINEGQPFNTVLILPGSGPTDRDGNSPVGIAASTYRLLAEELAMLGVASVRFDKRGLGGSINAGDGNDVSLESYADDVTSWLDAIDDIPEVSGNVWLVGHSEGALVAIIAAGRELTNVRALALLSAPGRKLGIVLREQLASNPANTPILAEAFSAIEMLERGNRVDPKTLHSGLRNLFNAPAQDYLTQLIRFDPAAALKKLGDGDDPLPVLIVHGGRDIQVSTEDVRALSKARPDAELAIIADMNHVLKSVDHNNREANVAAYSNPELPIVQNLVDILAEFIDKTSRSHKPAK